MNYAGLVALLYTVLRVLGLGVTDEQQTAADDSGTGSSPERFPNQAQSGMQPEAQVCHFTTLASPYIIQPTGSLCTLQIRRLPYQFMFLQA